MSCRTSSGLSWRAAQGGGRRYASAGRKKGLLRRPPPLFTQPRRRRILRSSQVRSSKKVRQEFIRSPSPLGNKAGMRERDAKQHGGIVSLRKCSSKEYCVRLRTYVWCVRSKACASVAARRAKPSHKAGSVAKRVHPSPREGQN